MIIDEAVISDARAKNGTDGPWSFRFVIENMAPAGDDPGEFVRRWLVEWATLTSYNGFPLDRPNEGRAGQMNSRVLCPWEQRTTSNGCNADCSVCMANPPKLDLAKAPFRLFAIINRMDLREQPDIGGSGEARFEFGLTNGAADVPTSPQMPMALIFEYKLVTETDAKTWAQRWHALGKYSAFDDGYKGALEDLTARWTKRGASPSGKNGSALGQLRTNESALDWIWQLREFVLGADGGLHLTGLRNTPASDLNGSKAITDYINANADAVRSEKFALPTALQGGAADALIYSWSFPNADPALARKFALNTCNGCHTEQQNVDSAFHISPFRSGPDRLSKFLYDPANRAGDQLTIREASYRSALCAQ